MIPEEEEEEEKIRSIPLGSRVECEGERGTLKYIGVVPPTQGMWLGIEWDDPCRGKHDGSFKGRTYFTTSHPTSGSFIRLKKVNIGCSCWSAIRNRYGEVEGENAGIDGSTFKTFQQYTKATVSEFVGLDKIRQRQSYFSELKIAWLRGMNVNGAGSEDELRLNVPRITELDLSQNLLSSWEEVAQITRQLNHLRCLNLSENKLHIPADPSMYHEAFQQVQQLTLGRLGYSWTDIMACVHMWPDISNLQVQDNNITDVECPPEPLLRNLRSLNLQGNKLRGWESVCCLGKLHSLEQLFLCDTGITSIHIPDVQPGEKSQLFPRLQSINLPKNGISEWVSFSELDKLQQLTEIKIQNNPVLNTENPETARQLVIARIAGLTLYNGSTVTSEERKGAELDYTKKHGKSFLAINKACDEDERSRLQQEFHAQHPRYAALVAKYGVPDEGELKEHTTTLKNALVSVEIFSPSSSWPAGIKKLPNTMTVQKVRTLVGRMFKVDCRDLQLTYISARNPEKEVPLDNDLRQLYFYSVENGDKLCVRW